MFLVKFGGQSRDRIWPTDIFLPQKGQAQQILGSLLGDALDGFPIPQYPLCLQKAQSNAELVDFDVVVLQDQIFEGIRTLLAEEAPILDIFRLQEFDSVQRRSL